MHAASALGNWLRNPRHLSAKLAFDLAMAGLVGFVAIFLFTWLIVSERFGELEHREVRTNVSRLQTLLVNQQNSVKAKSLDWSSWSDAYDFIANGNHAFIDGNLSTSALLNLDVSSISYVRFDRTLSISRYVDLAKKSEDSARAEALRAFIVSQPVLERARREAQFQTFARLGDKLLVLGFAHVLKDDGSGPPRGFIVIAREIEPQKISEQLQQKSSYDFQTISGPSDTRFLDNTIKVAVSLADIVNEPVATVRFTMARDIDAAGDNMLLIVGSGIALLLLGMVGILNVLLRRAVVGPLVLIEDHVRRIGDTKELALLTSDDRRDEIGTLRNGFNAMAEQLIALRSELETQSFELGKNQSVIGVMHNVRNGLSPVHTILSRMHEQLHFTGQENVGRAVAEVGNDEIPPDRRRKLAAFLAAAVEQYEQQLGTCRINARDAGRNLAMVLEAIEQVQAEDRASPEITDCSVSAILAASLGTARHACGDRIEVVLHGDNPAHVVRTNRVLLSQIIVNLLTNATESLAKNGAADGKIVIDQTIVEGPDGSMLRLFVTDNGEGFDPATTTKLFERGYSTRPGKSGGLGLHWCANTLNAMGGTLALHSDGPGRGATAELTLPLGAMPAGQMLPDAERATGG